MTLFKRSFLFTTLLLSIQIHSQTVPIDWVQFYNGPLDNTDQAADMVIDAAGNSYVTGTSMGVNGTFDIATVKYDISGTQMWVRWYDGSANDNDGATDIFLDAAGNVYVSGKARGTGTLEDLVAIKYDNAGTQQWAYIYSGLANLQDVGNAIGVDASGNVYVAGYTTLANTTTDWVMVKLNSAGVQQWLVTHNGTNNGSDEATDLIVNTSGIPFVTGSANETSGTLNDIVTKRIDPTNGSSTWTGTFNGVANDNDYGEVITLDKNGNVYVAGRTFVSGYWFNYVTISYNPLSGSQVWVSFYGYTDVNTNVKYEEVNAIVADSLSNVYITGQSQGNGNNGAQNDIATIKYNSAGTQVWVQRYTSSGNFDDRGHGIALDDTLNVYVTGYVTLSTTNKNFVTIKYDNAGNQLWLVTYDGPGGSIDDSRAIGVHDGGSVFVSGSGDVNPTSVVNDDYITIKYLPQNIGYGEYHGTRMDAFLFPNPATDQIHVSLSSTAIRPSDLFYATLVDVFGRPVMKAGTLRSAQGNAEGKFMISDLAAGAYILRITDESGNLIGASGFIRR